MRVPFCLPDITVEDKNAVLESLGSQWLTGGQRTVDFEKLFADYVGVKYAIAVNSCTAALHLAMRVLSIGIGDEVIVPTLTFAATANAPIFCGAKPVFADIGEETFNISCENIREKITKKTKAIVPVHLAGQPCEMEEILRIALGHNLYVVEDCAHSLGATYKGFPTGCLSDIGCFSFYATKGVTTCEGGMVATNSKELAEQVRLMRSHCMTKEAWERKESSAWRYDIVDLGYNYRMSEMQAALGISQLSMLDEMNRKRAKVAEYYTERLSKIKGIITPYQAKDRTNSHHLYIIRVIEKEFGMSRNKLFKRLAEKGVECSVHYKPLHVMSFYQREFGSKMGDCPIAEKIYEQVLSLPIFPTLSVEQMNYVVKKIKELAK